MSLANKGDFIHLIISYLNDKNSTNDIDFTQPHVRRSLRYVYPLFMFLHAVVGLIGLLGNSSILIVIGKRRLYRDQTFFFLGNLAFSDIIKCVFVLPITVANLLVHNWIFGSFMCFFLPMLQCFPFHCSMLTYLMTFIDRYRLIVNPFKTRAPAGLCITGVWVTSVCLVLPYAVYIKYVDLGAILGSRFEGVGLCYYNHERHLEEYIRAMFVTLYAMPLAVIGFLCVKISTELKTQENTTLSVQYDISNTANQSSNSEANIDASKTENESDMRLHRENACDLTTQYSDDEIDIAKEKRVQSYLITMVTLFAICWCPLNILVLVQNFVHENGNNMGHFDITYITFTWFCFLSTCINPVLFASWMMSSTAKERLMGYFRIHSRRRKKKKITHTTSTEVRCKETGDETTDDHV